MSTTTPQTDAALEPVASSDGRDAVTLFVFLLAAVALVASVIAVGFGMRAVDESKDTVAAGSGESAAAAPPVVTLSELKIEPASITAAVGSTLQIQNKGALTHNVSVEGTSLRTDMIDSGKTGSLALTGLKAGDYVLFCEVPGHKEAGMKATLHVTEGGTTVAASSTDSMAGMDHSTMTADQMDETMKAVTAAFPAKTEGVGGQLMAPTIGADGVKQYDLTTKIVKWEVEPGKFVDAWTYNGTVPGPTIKVDPGDRVRIVLHNELPESTVIHMHGIDLPNAMDGVPDITQPAVKPGDSFTYEFTAQSTPAVGMYHSHHDAAKQVANGLAGALLIGEEPLPKGVTVSQEETMMLNDAGTIGFSLNGKSFPATAPYVAKVGDWIEMHYLNEGVQAHPMHLHGMPQLVIAKDGFPVPQPYQADTVMVAPGERYTVLVHATNPGVWAWHCHILPHAEKETGMFGMVTALIVK
jgi:FtsP/CotA-like multicopper oxidase with cupredoxin domain